MDENENKQLKDEVESYKSLARTLHGQLKLVTQERDSFKSSLESKNVLIKKLEAEMEKKDKIIEYFMSQSTKSVEPKEGEDKEEISFDVKEDGQRTFEAQTKQKQVPVSIEKPSPIKEKQKNDNNVIEGIEIVCIEEPMQKLTGDTSDYDVLSPESQKTEELQSFSSGSTSKSLDNAKSKSLSSSSRPTRKREKSPLKENDQQRTSSRSSHVKRQKTSDESKRASSKRAVESEGRFSKSLFVNQEPRTRPPVKNNLSKYDVNVLNIPENLRYNFGTLDWELGDCEIGQKFWFDKKNAHMTKFFLKLHSDFGDWENKGYYILKEQIGLSPPQTHYIKFFDIREKLETTPNKRIWLDVRDFNLFSPSTQNLFGCASIESSITHFSLGDRYYSSIRFNASRVLEFIFKHLTNLEYCSINNGTLYYKKDFEEEDAMPVKYMQELPKLKTIRLINSKLSFSLSFISQLVNMSKNLDNFYAFPLNYLDKLVGRKILEKGSLRSVYIKRDNYNLSEMRALKFHEDLLYLVSEDKWDILDELDTRSFFLDCKSTTRSLCNEKLSEIIKRNANFLAKLRLGVSSSSSSVSSTSELKIPRLRNLKTLHLDMNYKNKRLEEPAEFFPKNFDIKTNFPKLSKVELYIEFANSARQNFRRLPQVMFEKYFPQDTFQPGLSFVQVECLTLRGFVVLNCMPQIAGLFPNLKRLCLYDNLRDIKKVLFSCYQHWKNLIQLVLETSCERNENLDSAFTGLSEERCDELRVNSGLEEVQKSMEKYGNEMPISHLTNLELIKIVLRPASNMDYSHEPVVTPVGAFALSELFDANEKQRRDFKLEIGFDERVLYKEKQIIIIAHEPILQLPFVVLER